MTRHPQHLLSHERGGRIERFVRGSGEQSWLRARLIEVSSSPRTLGCAVRGAVAALLRRRRRKHRRPQRRSSSFFLVPRRAHGASLRDRWAQHITARRKRLSDRRAFVRHRSIRDPPEVRCSAPLALPVTQIQALITPAILSHRLHSGFRAAFQISCASSGSVEAIRTWELSGFPCKSYAALAQSPFETTRAWYNAHSDPVSASGHSGKSVCVDRRSPCSHDDAATSRTRERCRARGFLVRSVGTVDEDSDHRQRGVWGALTSRNGRRSMLRSQLRSNGSFADADGVPRLH